MTFTKKPTIHEIARKNRDYFFSKETLKFFGQSINSFEVKLIAGRVFIYAPSYWRQHPIGYRFHDSTEKSQLMGYTFREWTKNNALINVSNVDNDLEAINNFLSKN